MFARRATHGLAVAAMLLAATAAADDHCRVDGPRFAHCPGTSANFHSVLVAVHGWNGTCNSTFGEGDGSLFRVIDRKQRFYDLDCFQYDSRDVSLQHNIARLGEQLDRLRAEGYRHVMFVTHSTGGVMVLRLLTDAFLADDASPRSVLADEALLGPAGLRVHALQAWATPINGVRAQIESGGRVLRVVGLSRETLHDLSPDSAFLRDLKTRLARLSALASSQEEQDREARARLRGVNVNFYHGQSDDWVVANIDESEAARVGWLWPPGRGGVIRTGTGHSHNVGSSGEVGAPKFPAHVMELQALLELPLAPRYDNLFRPDLRTVPKQLEDRQRQVVEALVLYAEHRFAATMDTALDFLSLMLTRSFSGRRSSQVDKVLVRGLVDLIVDRAASPDANIVRFLINFAHGVLERFDPTGAEDVQRVGHNHSDVVLDILRMVDAVHDAVLRYLRNNPDEVRRLIGPYGTIESFDIEMQRITQRFYGSTYHTVQGETVASTARMIDRAGAGTLARSGLVDGMLAYLDTAPSPPLAVRSRIGRAYNAAIAKTTDAHQLALLTEYTSARRDNGQPLWTRVADDAPIEALVRKIDIEVDTSRELVVFLTQVARYSGASGNNNDLARAASMKAISAANAARDGSAASLFDKAAASANLPVVRRQFDRAAAQLRQLER